MEKPSSGEKNLTLWARRLIACASVTHLIFARLHIKALLLLENDTCGFVMFLFVLFGLVALFESMRIRNDSIRERIFAGLMCFLTAGFGIFLVSIYRSALISQKAVETFHITNAITFSTVIIAAYLVSGAMIFTDLIRSGKKYGETEKADI
jgi:hypothetical protein